MQQTFGLFAVNETRYVHGTLLPGEHSRYVGSSTHQFDEYTVDKAGRSPRNMGCSWLFIQTSTLCALKTKVSSIRASNMTFAVFPLIAAVYLTVQFRQL